MWMRSKGLWWIKKVKWSTGCLGNGTRVFTAVSHLLPNACGGQVGIHNYAYTHRRKEFPNSVAVFCCFQAPCPQTMSSTMASPGLPLSWTNFAPSWKMCCPAQTLGSGPIKGTTRVALCTLVNNRWFAEWVNWKVTPGSCRYLEEGNLEMASSEKQRIEDLQRSRRRWREESNIKLEPCFFK